MFVFDGCVVVSEILFLMASRSIFAAWSAETVGTATSSATGSVTGSVGDG